MPSPESFAGIFPPRAVRSFSPGIPQGSQSNYIGVFVAGSIAWAPSEKAML